MALRIDHLSFAYGRHSALRDVTARAEPGRVIAVIGPNAAGKSTLLRCVIGALKPTGGRILLGDRPVHRMSARALAAQVAYVPQRSVVSAAFAVRQVVELGRYALAANPRQVSEAIERMDLTNVADRPYRTLSVGQQQRVTLARAFAQIGEGGYLVLDEPTSAMDLQHAAMTFRLLRESARDLDSTIIMAMHDLSMAAAVADDAWLLENGRLLAAGSACEVLAPDLLARVFGVGFMWVKDQSARARLLADVQISPPATRSQA